MLPAGLGCNAIAGIQDGQLATIDSGSGVDGMAEGSVDSGGGMDGPAGDGMDSTTGSDSTSPPADASDAGPPPSIRCSVNPGSKTLVADLSSFVFPPWHRSQSVCMFERSAFNSGRTSIGVM